MWRLRNLLPLLLAATLFAPAVAQAGPSQDFLEIYRAYQKAGVVDGCKFSAKKLASAKKGVPPDVDTYAPDFPDALDAALRRRASGACEKAAAPKNGTPGTASPAGAGGSTPTPGATSLSAGAGARPSATSGATGAATTTPAPAPEIAAAPGALDGSVASAAGRNASATTADDAPFPLVLLAFLSGLALLLGLAWAVAR
ncbi:MAG: hypothetical protein ACR2NB_03685, partial [Solirubrobacteraceae bacterium]